MVRRKQKIFIMYCNFYDIKFHCESIQGEKDFIDSWYYYFEEKITMTKANYYMKIIKSNSIWYKEEAICEFEYERIAYFCALNNIYLEKNLISSKRIIIHHWFLLFKKYVGAYYPSPSYHLHNYSYPHNKEVDLSKFMKRYIFLKKKIEKQRIETLVYYRKMKDIFNNKKINISYIVEHWNILFNEKITSTDASIHLEAMKEIDNLNYEDRIKLINFIIDNNILFNDNSIISQLLFILNKIFNQKYFNINQTQNILLDLRNNFSKFFNANKIGDNENTYLEIREYCNSNFISLNHDSNISKNQVIEIYQILYMQKIKEGNALLIVKYMKKYYSDIFITNDKSLKVPKLKDIDNLSINSRKEFLIIFAEYCRKNKIYILNDYDIDDLNLQWRRCFGL
ncbi:hypothetical protein [Poseidonibacter ostreae]|uniref:Uncharacterized protein n=1 Tax=Poseidonibacter ostreae TaxID=2654171 RepID=A0ABQ6VM38_9BACT|nr:hypothetical protein [Poseidonibacter ostreae]KAB7891530.1 hypothetical protein GBG18_06615 [Poseidonibacter ostreae]